MTNSTETATTSRLDEPWDESVDRIPDETFEKLEGFVRGLRADFDVSSMQAHTSSVTCTIKFDNAPGPMAQADAAEHLFAACGMVETLFRNLRHERGLDPAENGSKEPQS